MKKLLPLLLTTALVLSLAACGNKNNNNNDSSTPSGGVEAPSVSEPSSPAQASIKDALELLNNVWAQYTDDEKFPAAGGDFSEENSVSDAPGKFDISNSDSLAYSLTFPEAYADKIDGAASLIHMMNTNTFTCGAFHVKDSADISSITEAIKTTVLSKHWMCGFPDKLVIAVVDDYIISFYGHEDLINTFKTNLTKAYSSAEFVCEEPIL